MKIQRILPLTIVLSGCALVTPNYPVHFFERTNPGAARCFQGGTLARGGATRETAQLAPVYLVLDTISYPAGGDTLPGWVIGTTRRGDVIGLLWFENGDHLQLEEWGVLPGVTYMLRDSADELSGSAAYESDAYFCSNGVCHNSKPTWQVHARRVPCADVLRYHRERPAASETSS
jgi:hypothetical protein